MLDPRQRQQPVLHLIGLLLFGGLAAWCLYQFSSGIAVGEVRCLPSRSCRRRAEDPFYAFAEEPVYFAGELVFWLWFGIVCAGLAWWCGSTLAGAGWIFRRARHRRQRRLTIE
jgi:hypothetical protein